MSVADAIVEVADYLGAVADGVAAIAGHGRVGKLAGVLVSIEEVHDSFALHQPSPKVSLVDAVRSVQDAAAMDQAITELALVSVLAAGPDVDTLTTELSVLEKALKNVAVALLQDPGSLDYVGEEVPLVYQFQCFVVGRVPCHFALAVHLGVDEMPYVVPAIGPFELSVAMDLRILKGSSIDEVFIRFDDPWNAVDGDGSIECPPPSLVSLAGHLPVDEVATNFDLAPLQFLDPLASHLVLHPVSGIL